MYNDREMCAMPNVSAVGGSRPETVQGWGVVDF